MYYFSPETFGFYNSELHGKNIPVDAFVISDKDYESLVIEALSGTVLSLNSKGFPERISSASQNTPEVERAWRNKILESTQWLVIRDNEELEMGEGTTLNTEQFRELLAYRQALRDWPSAVDFPDVEYRPVEPAWLESVLQEHK
jgi:hypothetical protein